MHFYPSFVHATDNDIVKKVDHITVCFQAMILPEKVDPEYELLLVLLSEKAKSISILFYTTLFQATMLNKLT